MDMPCIPVLIVVFESYVSENWQRLGVVQG